jgi:hypothetical protein
LRSGNPGENDFGGQAMKIGILNAGNIGGTLAKAWGG